MWGTIAMLGAVGGRKIADDLTCQRRSAVCEGCGASDFVGGTCQYCKRYSTGHPDRGMTIPCVDSIRYEMTTRFGSKRNV